jgi:hypothetical protein
MDAPLGKNLESACKAWARTRAIRDELPAEVACAECGRPVPYLVRRKDAHRRHFCSPGCAIDWTESNR